MQKDPWFISITLSYSHPHLGVTKLRLCKLWPYEFLLLNCVDVQLWTERWGWDSYSFMPAPQIVPMHLVAFTLDWNRISVGSVWWMLCFLPVCGNGALFPSSQGYFHLNDLFYLPGAPHYYPLPFHSACLRNCFTCYSSNCCLWYISISDSVAALKEPWSCPA